MQLSTDNLVAIGVACIGGIAFVTSAAIPLLISIRKQTKLSGIKADQARDKAIEAKNKAVEALFAIENDHPINLRIDLDDKFKIVSQELKAIHNSVTKLSEKDKLLTRRIAANRARITRQNNLINEIKTFVKDI
jgi:hypothetical protein